MASINGMSVTHEPAAEDRAKILLVDDSSENLVSLEASLKVSDSNSSARSGTGNAASSAGR